MTYGDHTIDRTNFRESGSDIQKLPLRYRRELGWDVRPAHRLRVALCVGVVTRICDCWRGAACPTPGKHPVGKWKTGDGLVKPSLAELAADWGLRPWNVAFLLGDHSGGLLVADVDPRHDGRLDTLWEMGWPHDTPIARTGGGGWHVYVQGPPQGVKSLPRYAPGIELKANGNLVIAPPSRHVSGGRYAWLKGRSPFEIHVAPLPETVLAAMRTGKPREAAPTVALDADTLAALPTLQRRSAPRFLKRAIARALANADGGRHNTGVWLACQLRDLRVPDEVGAALMLAYQQEVEALGC